MPNFTKKPEELVTHFDRWLYVFKHLAYFEEQPPFIQEEILQKVFHIAKVAKLDKKEQAVYEQSIKIYRDLKNSFDYANET